MMACIGCIKLLTYLASKYLDVGAHHQNSTTTLSNISLYIYGNLTNHCMAMNFLSMFMRGYTGHCITHI